MNDENEAPKYLLRAVLQKNFLTTVYIVAKDFTDNGHLPPMNESFLKGSDALMKRAEDEENETYFEMEYVECLYLLDMFSRIEAVFTLTLPTFEARLLEMTEIERENYEMSIALKEMMTQVKNEMTETFPQLGEIFEEAEKLRKKMIDDAKTMNLDNENVINAISMKEPFHGNYILLMFSFFEAFITLGESSFSKRVREADFYCIKDIKAVRERMINAIAESLVQTDYFLEFTLEDLFVLFMVNHIYQKIYASDAGDDVEYFMVNTKFSGFTATVKEIRTFTLQLSAKLELLLAKIGEDDFDFEDLIVPVKEFEVG